MQTPQEIDYRLLVASIKDYAIFQLDPEGHILSWNEGAQRIKGYAASEIVGKHFSTFYPQEALKRGWPEHELKVAAAEGRFEDEGWRVRKDGSLFWASVVITALRDPSGKLVGFAKTTRDQTDRRRQEESLRQSEERFRLLVEGVKDYGIFMLDTSGTVMSWNAGAESITGYTADEIIGQNFSRFYPAELMEKSWPDHELAVARTHGRYEEEGWRVRKDGSRFIANIVITALFNRDGTLRGYAKVTRDLTLRARVRALEESEQQMSQFLAMLSHELRNPLAPIRNAVEILQAAPGSVMASKSRDIISRQVTHLSRLVDDLLDVSRITRATIGVQKSRVDLAEVVRRSVESTTALAQAKGQRVGLDIPEDALCVSGDATRLEQVLVNLLTNAVKFTPEGGFVHVALRRSAGEAEIRVRDSGRGMEPDTIERVFDLFYQRDTSLDRSEGGLGVGLALVKKVIELHDGRVGATSEGLGKGSEFVLRLPLLAGMPAQAAPEQAPLPRAEAANRVLVVDDNQDAADSMAILLEALGHEVKVSYDGNAAVDDAKSFSPHYVLLDIGLPGKSGYEVAAELRRTPALARTVIIAVTGYGQPSDRERISAAGFNHHLVKPVELATLQNLIAQPQRALQ